MMCGAENSFHVKMLLVSVDSRRFLDNWIAKNLGNCDIAKFVNFVSHFSPCEALKEKENLIFADNFEKHFF